MWVIVRIIAAAITLVVRQWYVLNPPTPQGMLQGKPYYIKTKRYKGRTTQFSIGFPFEAPAFALTLEGALDRFFKKIRFSREYQTGDAEFDKDIYIASDHAGVCEFISKEKHVRSQVIVLFQGMGFDRISCDGGVLWLRNPENREPNSDELAAARELHRLCEPMTNDPRLKLPDPFFWRALIIESIVWSIFAYAVGGFLENIIHTEDYHVNQPALIELGLLVGAGLFVILVAVLFLDLHRSSRGHRVLVECGFLLLIGFPGAGVQAVSDANRSLDKTEPVRLTRRIDHLERHEHRGRHSTTYTYHMYLDEDQDDRYGIPAEIEITQDLFEHASSGDIAILSVSGGWLGLPWYRSIDLEDSLDNALHTH